jgi:thioredoxin-like negative regulator of GroEL
VDVDECEELAVRYNISSMPTFVFIKNKEQVDSFSGANAEKLEKYIVQHSS